MARRGRSGTCFESNFYSFSNVSLQNQLNHPRTHSINPHIYSPTLLQLPLAPRGQHLGDLLHHPLLVPVSSIILFSLYILGLSACFFWAYHALLFFLSINYANQKHYFLSFSFSIQFQSSSRSSSRSSELWWHGFRSRWNDDAGNGVRYWQRYGTSCCRCSYGLTTSRSCWSHPSSSNDRSGSAALQWAGEIIRRVHVHV